MKNIIITVSIFLFSISFISCANHNSYISNKNLNWAGTYIGEIPAASVAGIKVSITLNADKSYKITYEYIGKDSGIFESSGSFTWKDNGNIISLDSKNFPPFYKILNNALIQLDLNGQEITGQLADNYILRKDN